MINGGLLDLLNMETISVLRKSDWKVIKLQQI